MFDSQTAILIIIDSQEERERVIGCLEEDVASNYKIMEAASAHEGVHRYRMDKPDCVLINDRLPDADCLEILSELTWSLEGEPVLVPAVVLLEKGNEALALFALKQGGQDYLYKKNMNMESLRHVVSNSILKVMMQTELDRQRSELEARNVELDSLVRELEEARKILHRQASHDPLTGLFNRRRIMEELDEQFSSALRHGYPLSLCICDIDHFKTVNDTYGHLVGDAILDRFGKLARDCLRTVDMVGRYGGDEFVIVLPQTTPEKALAGIERVRRLLDDTEFKSDDGTVFRVTATFGIAGLNSPDISTTRQLFELADEALYEAKKAGRNTVRTR